jgi:hypothetical protein
MISIYVRKILRRTYLRFSNRRRLAVARKDFALLDASTLRDLGMDRSEFDSYWAESNGLAVRTRIRAEPTLCGILPKKAQKL